MRARKITDRTVEVDKCGMSVGFCVVEDTLDASFFCYGVGVVLSVLARRTEMGFPFSKSDFNCLGRTLELCSENCGFACLAGYYGSFE